MSQIDFINNLYSINCSTTNEALHYLQTTFKPMFQLDSQHRLDHHQLHCLISLAYTCNAIRCFNASTPGQPIDIELVYNELILPCFGHLTMYQLTSSTVYIDLTVLMYELLTNATIDGYSNEDWFKLLIQEYDATASKLK